MFDKIIYFDLLGLINTVKTQYYYTLPYCSENVNRVTCNQDIILILI